MDVAAALQPIQQLCLRSPRSKNDFLDLRMPYTQIGQQVEIAFREQWHFQDNSQGNMGRVAQQRDSCPQSRLRHNLNARRPQDPYQVAMDLRSFTYQQNFAHHLRSQQRAAAKGWISPCVTVSK